MKFDEVEVAWAAGFFDGEGCVQAYQQKYILETRLSASNRDVRPLKRLKEIFGGRIVQEARTDGRDPIWVWKISGEASETVARAMLNHCSAKYDQLELYIELRETIRPGNRGGGIALPDAVHEKRTVIVGEIKGCKAHVNRQSARLP